MNQKTYNEAYQNKSILMVLLDLMQPLVVLLHLVHVQEQMVMKVAKYFVDIDEYNVVDDDEKRE